MGFDEGRKYRRPTKNGFCIYAIRPLLFLDSRDLRGGLGGPGGVSRSRQGESDKKCYFNSGITAPDALLGTPGCGRLSCRRQGICNAGYHGRAITVVLVTDHLCEAQGVFNVTCVHQRYRHPCEVVGSTGVVVPATSNAHPMSLSDDLRSRAQIVRVNGSYRPCNVDVHSGSGRFVCDPGCGFQRKRQNPARPLFVIGSPVGGRNGTEDGCATMRLVESVGRDHRQRQGLPRPGLVTHCSLLLCDSGKGARLRFPVVTGRVSDRSGGSHRPRQTFPRSRRIARRSLRTGSANEGPGPFVGVADHLCCVDRQSDDARHGGRPDTLFQHGIESVLPRSPRPDFGIRHHGSQENRHERGWARAPVPGFLHGRTAL